MTHHFDQAELKQISPTLYPGVYNKKEQNGEARRSVRKTVCTKEALGITLFNAGFKEIHNAASLYAALGALVGDSLIHCSEYCDRIELAFSYLHTNSWSTDHRSSNNNTSKQMLTLRAILRRMSSAYHLEVHEGELFHECAVKLTLLKVPLFVVLNDQTAPACKLLLDWVDLLTAKAYRFNSKHDRDLIAMVLRHAETREVISIKDYWVEYFATLNISTPLYATFNRAIQHVSRFNSDIGRQYRFVVVHYPNGKTALDVLRRNLLD